MLCETLVITPRLFGEEASDIGGNLIAITLLQQQNRAGRPAKKQARIRGRITWVSGVTGNVLVEGAESCIVLRANSG